MAGETKFSRIKRIVEEEKNKKVRAETRKATLEEEKERIFAQVKQESGKDITSIEELEQMCDTLKGQIEQDIERIANILLEEGLEF